MADTWTSPVVWAPHQRGLAEWAARKWGWTAGDADWPSGLALLAGVEDEGHTALDWSRAAEFWDRLAPEGPAFALPPPSGWPGALFDQGWLVRKSSGAAELVQTARNAALEARLVEGLLPLVAPEGAPGEGQDEAVARAGNTRLMLLVGGPGTGKTTTLKRMVATWASKLPGLRAVVAAPTGRAAARARESFADAAVVPGCLTLHRLLGLRPGLGSPWHGPHRPLPFDLVIVDEASMLDLRTAAALVGALAPGAALVLVGDPGQLPSVEAGSVLADLLAHPRFAGAVVRLTQRYRLNEESRALARVFDLLQRPPANPEEVVEELRVLGGGQHRDFRWIETQEAEDPGPLALDAWGSPRGMDLADLGRRILLSPVHQGPGGAETLGAQADRLLGRPPGSVDDGLPWMIQRNLPHLGLHNGDRGLVVRSQGRLWFVTPVDPERRLAFPLVADDGISAWAVTVHKSQGSEFDRVVLVLPPHDSPVMVRELLYTGLTRARRSAVLVGSAASLSRALVRGADRMSGLGPSR